MKHAELQALVCEGLWWHVQSSEVCWDKLSWGTRRMSQLRYRPHFLWCVFIPMRLKTTAWEQLPCLHRNLERKSHLGLYFLIMHNWRSRRCGTIRDNDCKWVPSPYKLTVLLKAFGWVHTDKGRTREGLPRLRQLFAEPRVQFYARSCRICGALTL